MTWQFFANDEFQNYFANDEETEQRFLFPCFIVALWPIRKLVGKWINRQANLFTPCLILNLFERKRELDRFFTCTMFSFSFTLTFGTLLHAHCTHHRCAKKRKLVKVPAVPSNFDTGKSLFPSPLTCGIAGCSWTGSGSSHTTLVAIGGFLTWLSCFLLEGQFCGVQGLQGVFLSFWRSQFWCEHWWNGLFPDIRRGWWRCLQGFERWECLSVGLWNHQDDEDGVCCTDAGEVEEQSSCAQESQHGGCYLHLVMVMVMFMVMVMVIMSCTAMKMPANWTDIRVPETTLFNSGANHSAEEKCK